MAYANPHDNTVPAHLTHCQSRRIKQHLLLPLRVVDGKLEQTFRGGIPAFELRMLKNSKKLLRCPLFCKLSICNSLLRVLQY